MLLCIEKTLVTTARNNIRNIHLEICNESTFFMFLPVAEKHTQQFLYRFQRPLHPPMMGLLCMKLHTQYFA